LTWSPDDTNDAIKNYRGRSVALKFVEIDHIIIKKKMRWLKLACWYFACYLAGKRTD